MRVPTLALCLGLGAIAGSAGLAGPTSGATPEVVRAAGALIDLGSWSAEAGSLLRNYAAAAETMAEGPPWALQSQLDALEAVLAARASPADGVHALASACPALEDLYGSRNTATARCVAAWRAALTATGRADEAARLPEPPSGLRPVSAAARPRAGAPSAAAAATAQELAAVVRLFLTGSADEQRVWARHVAALQRALGDSGLGAAEQLCERTAAVMVAVSAGSSPQRALAEDAPDVSWPRQSEAILEAFREFGTEHMQARPQRSKAELAALLATTVGPSTAAASGSAASPPWMAAAAAAGALLLVLLLLGVRATKKPRRRLRRPPPVPSPPPAVASAAPKPRASRRRSPSPVAPPVPPAAQPKERSRRSKKKSKSPAVPIELPPPVAPPSPPRLLFEPDDELKRVLGMSPSRSPPSPPAARRRARKGSRSRSPPAPPAPAAPAPTAPAPAPPPAPAAPVEEPPPPPLRISTRAPPPPPPDVAVRFETPFLRRQAGDGLSVAVVGADGQWAADRALPLHWAARGEWRLSARLPGGPLRRGGVRYRFLRTASHGRAQWERDEHVLDLRSTPAVARAAPEFVDAAELRTSPPPTPPLSSAGPSERSFRDVIAAGTLPPVSPDAVVAQAWPARAVLALPPTPDRGRLAREQIEFYFSTANLVRDVFLRERMDAEGFVFVSVLANFNRVRTLSQGLGVAAVVEALADSELLELTGAEPAPERARVRVREGWQKWPLAPGSL